MFDPNTGLANYTISNTPKSTASRGGQEQSGINLTLGVFELPTEFVDQYNHMELSSCRDDDMLRITNF